MHDNFSLTTRPRSKDSRIRSAIGSIKVSPHLEPEAVARRLVAVWDGQQAQWLVAPAFDLAEEILAAFRQLSGQYPMQARQAFEKALAEP